MTTTMTNEIDYANLTPEQRRKLLEDAMVVHSED